MNINYRNPFVIDGILKDRRLFVGREDEMRAIVNRMTGIQPISINIIGEKKIGKSSLLYHFYQTWRERVINDEKYIVIYLSLSRCQTEGDFYEEVVDNLVESSNQPLIYLKKTFLNKSINRRKFSRIIRSFQEKKILPVICLDDFGRLLERPQKFDKGFYDHLRYLMDDSALMLVIASRRSLADYAREKELSSPFFNIGHTLELGKLTEDEAIKITSLISKNKISAELHLNEQKKAIEWGELHPYKLQLSCFYLWEARQQGRDIKWARIKFIKNINVRQSKITFLKLNHWDKLLSIFSSLGKFSFDVGDFFDKFHKAIIGIALLISIVLICLDKLEVSDLIQKFFNELFEIGN
ncbi:TniB family NTP-binding protein [Mastigocoleus testarum]|uniref:AAA family ATPase n=1 Tax=Mastigocoleus testarum BC008 TaxID=371196 RepID=A0A0V7ZKW0_9CYAN|nr:ATP-binding protein [Mastigocoleus testarum]KST62795.1 hypothetical protein BC008_10740 [Mastigocoleus testarum BC008]KST65112.1 hypothetical protein BC008_20130 [Mastigocoleus testarum BC008]